MADIYPMPVFLTLAVENVSKSAEWYHNALNFTTIFAMNDPITNELNFVHLRRKKYQDILLVKGQTDRAMNTGGIAVTFQAWEDIDLLTQHAQKYGTRVLIAPHDTAWNTREVTFRDNDGYVINFTYPGAAIIKAMLDTDPQLLQSEAWEKK
jgi:uncharacterized glyoxalase superfamily protein PhnB